MSDPVPCSAPFFGWLLRWVILYDAVSPGGTSGSATDADAAGPARPTAAAARSAVRATPAAPRTRDRVRVGRRTGVTPPRSVEGSVAHRDLSGPGLSRSLTWW